MKRFLTIAIFCCLCLPFGTIWAQESISKPGATFGLAAGFSNFVSGRSASLNFQFSPDRSNVFYAGPSGFINWLRTVPPFNAGFHYWADENVKLQLGLHSGWIHLFHLSSKVKPFMNLHQELYRLNNNRWKYTEMECYTVSEDYIPIWVMENSLQTGLQIQALNHLGVRASGGVGSMFAFYRTPIVVRGVFKMEVFVNF